MNFENYCKTLARIEAHQEQWDQTNIWWGGDGPKCLLGHAHQLSGKDWSRSTLVAGAKFIEATDAEADWLWKCVRTLDDFRRVRHVAATCRLLGSHT